MRVLIEFESLTECEHDLKYYHKLQGAVYGLIKDTDYSKVHDIKGYKYFCFSNIFPVQDLKKGDIRHLIISSPNRTLIEIMRDSLFRCESLNIGSMRFKINSINEIEPKIETSCALITGTPIVHRIPRSTLEKYGIKLKQNYDYVYWRKEYPFNAFLKQIEENLLKKYYHYHNYTKGELKESKFLPLFQQFLFKKTVCCHVILDNREVKVIGSLWEFMFSSLTKEQKELLQFGLDAGFGELNTLGFGFMNIKQAKCSILN